MDVILPALRGRPDIRFRSYAGRPDIPKVKALFERMRPVDGFDWPVSEQDLIDDFEDSPISDTHRDLIFADAADTIVAYAQVWWQRDPNGPLLYSFYIGVDPDVRGTGIGEALLGWCEARSRENSKAHDPSAPKFLHLPLADKAAYLSGLLESHGYWVYRHGLSMLRPGLDDIPDHRLPEGLEVREVRPEHHDSIRLAWNEACRDMRGQIPIEKHTWDKWSKQPSFDPALWSVAWHGDDVIGTVFGMIDPEANALNNRKRGMVELISTRRDWRGKGVAKALMCRTMRLLRERGMTEAGLGVDEENPSGARHLYERMGFRVTERITFYRKGL